jgi:hypothetical protein
LEEFVDKIGDIEKEEEAKDSDLKGNGIKMDESCEFSVSKTKEKE